MRKLFVKIDKKSRGSVLSGTITAPSNGTFVASLKCPNGYNGGVTADFKRGTSTLGSMGLAIQVSSTVNIPDGSFSYHARTGDKMIYDIRRSGTLVSGGVGFNPD